MMRLFWRLGRPVVYAACASFCLLLAMQAALSITPLRQRFSYVDRLEGQEVAQVAPRAAVASLTVASQNVPAAPAERRLMIIRLVPPGRQEKIKVLLNNQVAADMSQGLARLYVREGDVVAVDATLVPETQHYIWESVPPGGVSPAAEQQFSTAGNVCSLGPIRVVRE